MFHCKTSSQFKAYQWIKNNFEIDSLNLEIVDDRTIKIIDKNLETAKIQYKNNKIIIEYKDKKKQIINLPNNLYRQVKAKDFKSFVLFQIILSSIYSLSTIFDIITLLSSSPERR